jgi:hypothetical protein
MSAGRSEQFDKSNPPKRGLRKLIKRWKHKRERKRVKGNPECEPEYRKYDGWER